MLQIKDFLKLSTNPDVRMKRYAHKKLTHILYQRRICTNTVKIKAGSVNGGDGRET